DDWRKERPGSNIEVDSFLIRTVICPRPSALRRLLQRLSLFDPRADPVFSLRAGTAASTSAGRGSVMADRQQWAALLAVRRQQQQEWEAGGRRPAEEYLARNPQLRQEPDAVLELIYQEIVLRTRAGEAPALAEYLTRFPEFADRLGPLFEVHQVLESLARSS